MNALHLLVIATSEQKTNNDQEINIIFDKIFNYFTSKKININLQDDKGFTSLHYAVMKKNEHVAMALISTNGINLNVRKFS